MVGRVTPRHDNNDNARLISPPAVPVPDLDRVKIDAHSLHIVIVEEYSNGKISKLSINLDTH